MDLLDSDAENKSPSTEETKNNDNPVPLVMTEGTEPSPLPNINTGMTQRHTATAASVQPSPSTNTQQDQTTSFTHYSGPTDVEENAHSLPATLTDGIHQPPKDGGNKAVIYFKRALYDKKMALNFFVVVLIGTVSLMTSVKLMKNTPMFPSVTTSSIELRKDSTYKDIQLGHEMSGMEVSEVYPNIVWLFAFPQSGAAYIMHLIHVVTRTATASNYGHVVMDPKGVVHVNNRDSIRTYGTGGPALFSGSIFPPPEKHILTWAAGDGACRNCHPKNYMYNYAKFREFCWRGTIMKDGEQVDIKYNPQLVKGAVHLYRDPFDNVVLRFWAEREEASKEEKKHWLHRYPPSNEGFQLWCKDRDEEWLKVETAWYGDEVMAAADGVVCRQEFYKLIMYHNNVVRSRASFQLETLLLKYEDLYNSYFRTIGMLVNFLELPVVSKAPPKDIQVGFSRYYFTEDQRDATFKFMDSIALSKVKDMMNEYKETTVAGT